MNRVFYFLFSIIISLATAGSLHSHKHVFLYSFLSFLLTLGMPVLIITFHRYIFMLFLLITCVIPFIVDPDYFSIFMISYFSLFIISGILIQSRFNLKDAYEYLENDIYNKLFKKAKKTIPLYSVYLNSQKQIPVLTLKDNLEIPDEMEAAHVILGIKIEYSNLCPYFKKDDIVFISNYNNLTVEDIYLIKIEDFPVDFYKVKSNENGIFLYSLSSHTEKYFSFNRKDTWSLHIYGSATVVQRPLNFQWWKKIDEEIAKENFTPYSLT